MNHLLFESEFAAKLFSRPFDVERAVESLTALSASVESIFDLSLDDLERFLALLAALDRSLWQPRSAAVFGPVFCNLFHAAYTDQSLKAVEAKMRLFGPILAVSVALVKRGADDVPATFSALLAALGAQLARTMTRIAAECAKGEPAAPFEVGELLQAVFPDFDLVLQPVVLFDSYSPLYFKAIFQTLARLIGTAEFRAKGLGSDADFLFAPHRFLTFVREFILGLKAGFAPKGDAAATMLGLANSVLALALKVLFGPFAGDYPWPDFQEVIEETLLDFLSLLQCHSALFFQIFVTAREDAVSELAGVLQALEYSRPMYTALGAYRRFLRRLLDHALREERDWRRRAVAKFERCFELLGEELPPPFDPAHVRECPSRALQLVLLRQSARRCYALGATPATVRAKNTYVITQIGFGEQRAAAKPDLLSRPFFLFHLFSAALSFRFFAENFAKFSDEFLELPPSDFRRFLLTLAEHSDDSLCSAEPRIYTSLLRADAPRCLAVKAILLLGAAVQPEQEWIFIRAVELFFEELAGNVVAAELKALFALTEVVLGLVETRHKNVRFLAAALSAYLRLFRAFLVRLAEAPPALSRDAIRPLLCAALLLRQLQRRRRLPAEGALLFLPQRPLCAAAFAPNAAFCAHCLAFFRRRALPVPLGLLAAVRTAARDERPTRAKTEALRRGFGSANDCLMRVEAANGVCIEFALSVLESD